jgi:hypothetical protein
VGVDDYMDSEAGIIAAATAAAVSPRARDLFRRGAVYGLAGVLRTGDIAVAAARGAVRAAKAEAGAGSNGARATPAKPRQTRKTTRRPRAASTAKKSGSRPRSGRG